MWSVIFKWSDDTEDLSVENIFAPYWLNKQNLVSKKWVHNPPMLSEKYSKRLCTNLLSFTILVDLLLTNCALEACNHWALC